MMKTGQRVTATRNISLGWGSLVPRGTKGTIVDAHQGLFFGPSYTVRFTLRGWSRRTVKASNLGAHQIKRA